MTKMHRAWQGVMAAIVLWLIWNAACTKPPYDPRRNHTIANLQSWSEVLDLVLKHQLDDPTRYEKLEAVIEAWSEKQFISKYARGSLSGDGWGRPFHWNATKTQGGITVRVISSGPDGIFQNGAGDDLVVEVSTAAKGQVSVHESWRR